MTLATALSVLLIVICIVILLALAASLIIPIAAYISYKLEQRREIREESGKHNRLPSHMMRHDDAEQEFISDRK